MKFLKKLLLFIVSFIIGIALLVLIAGLFAKKDYSVDKEVIINKPKQQVFNYIKYLKNQDSYSIWATMDANMKREYKGTDGTIGFVSAWESVNNDKVGKGEQEIMKMDEGKRVDYELRFIKPFKSKSNAYMTTEAVTDSTTKVHWGFTGKWDYPLNVMGLFMSMDEAVGKDFQYGLDKMKTILEK